MTSLAKAQKNRRMYCGVITILSGINTQLVDAGGCFREDVDSVTGVCHVVEEIDRNRREGEHQQPDYNQDICDHDELWEECIQISVLMHLILKQ